MSQGYHIVVCGSVVPDPLQTLEPIETASGPALKNEMMLPAVLDPWAGHALFEAANLAKNQPGSKVRQSAPLALMVSQVSLARPADRPAKRTR